jgi:hypothetical protein
MNKYLEIYRISIHHEFFEENQCSSINISPTGSCRNELNNLGLFIKRRSINEWSLLIRNDELHKENFLFWLYNKQSLDFCMEVTHNDFFLYTNWPDFSFTKDYAFEVDHKALDALIKTNKVKFGLLPNNGTIPVRIIEKEKSSNHGIAILNTTFSREIIENRWANPHKDPYHINIQFYPLKVRWEFIMLPRNNKKNQKLILRESEKLLNLSPLEEFEMLPGQNAYKGFTTEDLYLKENYSYQIQLWEKRNQGKKIILDHIPIPITGECPVNKKHDELQVITRYCYF